MRITGVDILRFLDIKNLFIVQNFARVEVDADDTQLFAIFG